MPANWTPPATWHIDQLVTHDDLNAQVRDNLEYLLSPSHERILRDNGSEYSITNVTAFQDIDSANLSIELAVHGGPVLVHLQGVVRVDAGDQVFFDFAVDGTRVAAAFDWGLTRVICIDAGDRVPLSILILLTGLSAGTYTLRPQWRSDSGSTAYLHAGASAAALVFEAIEL